MYQHQHTPLPLNELEGAPQPLIILLEALLEKDPGRRFQNPGELLKAIPTITAATDARRRITRQGLQKILPAASHAVTRKRPAKPATEKISVARLPVTGSAVFSVKRTSVSWTMHGQTSRSMLLQLLPGAESENRRSSTIGCDELLLKTIVLRNSYLDGLSTDRVPVAVLRRPMNF